jgi:hypothetical protein
MKSFVDVDGFFYVCKMMKIDHKKTFGYIINIYFHFKKNWIRFMMISKIAIECFQINLMLNLLMHLRLELLKLVLNIYSLGVTFFFNFFIPNVWQVLCHTNFLEFVFFFIFSSTKTGKLIIIIIIIIMLAGGGS